MTDDTLRRLMVAQLEKAQKVLQAHINGTESVASLATYSMKSPTRLRWLRPNTGTSNKTGNTLMVEPTKEDIKIAEGLSKLYLEASAEQLDLTRRIASMRASEREKAAKVADRFQVEGEMMPTLRAQNLTAVAIAAAIRAGDKE